MGKSKVIEIAPVESAEVLPEAPLDSTEANMGKPSPELLAAVDDVEPRVAGLKTSELVAVVLQRQVGGYNAGETAGFEPAVAEQLVAGGFATKA